MTVIIPLPSSANYYDIGTFARTVTTPTPEAQVWFDRGLTWTYGFCHLEAERCFKHALEHDPTFVMAYWGLAYTIGPNYNKPWELHDEQDLLDTLRNARQASLNAIKHITPESSEVEVALAKAILTRYPEEEVAAGKDFLEWNKTYAEAMKMVYEKFGGGGDLDIAALYADALMNLAPWDLWDLGTGLPRSTSRTVEVQSVLEKALADPRSSTHPGLLHLYIHVMEMSVTPEKALGPADLLRGLIPDSGHLEHMPSHIDLLVGDWAKAMQANKSAISADAKYAVRSSSTDFYTFYRLHDIQTFLYAAMHTGRYVDSLWAVDNLEAATPENLLRTESPPLADWLETVLNARAHVLVRFGKWEEILQLKLPKDKELYSATTANVHYARGVAYAALGRVEEAIAEREVFHAAIKRIQPTRIIYPNKCVDVIQVGEAMLDGEIAYRQGDFDIAFQRLEDAVRICDGLTYTEPPAWMQPPRHALAGLKLEQGLVEEALDIYATDLGIINTLSRPLQHPNNVWALHGYHECLVKLGQTEEAKRIEEKVANALKMADVKIYASCFCARGKEASDAGSSLMESCCE
ncbi:hypothetical protein CI109_106687 [Kwoniella shandongensis]|uniref:Uncharacterized protein n=1 Tax=Kwoniella shandongensis TaxID=1734106 RepID=A0A5M6BUP7_9TREE|nr:uncharacterized protein CI109_006425 [Kwoniella shandongensis]KAA5525255.1 hypothetical protein CI109_006425 [Kwoniella shandongensis]